MLVHLEAKDIILQPEIKCNICPRLYHYLEESRKINPSWHNAPVASFVPLVNPYESELLIVGLAPGLKGANRTGRPFTGDYAGILLYDTLKKFGFAKGQFNPNGEDDLQLINSIITNAVRCVPPQNKPLGEEITNCRPFLSSLIQNLTQLKVIVTLGSVAHNSLLKILGLKLKDYPFQHAKVAEYNDCYIISSYHCSKYNTQTRRLTTEMFEEVFDKARQFISL